mmetsp:Transcript_13969/g.21142  ORF Transcript_13969/g.21142 Transcript_13969/m.21142 type:complete len:164 (-) Transcript_13969:19-510(-)
MKSHHNEFMDAAFEQANLAFKLNEVPVGCVFVDDRSQSIVACGHNIPNKTNNATDHAEIVALKQLSSSLTKPQLFSLLKHIVVYVTVEPCMMCGSALQFAQIKSVFFGCSNPRFGGQSLMRALSSSPHRDVPCHSLSSSYEQKAISLLKAFYAQSNPNVSLKA